MKTLRLLMVLVLFVGCGGPTTRCLVSPLSGTVVANGKPVEGATVTRKYNSHWYNKHVEEVVHTDSQGFFEFKGAWKKALINVAHQPVVNELVMVEHNGTNYTMLDISKLNYDEYGELKALQDNSRLSKQNGKLHFTYNLEADKVPIGRPR